MANPNLPSIISNINAMNSVDLKLVISSAQKALPMAIQKETAAAQQQQAPQQPATAPVAAQPAPQMAPTPAPAMHASVDTSGKYGVMRKVKQNVVENYDDASDYNGYNKPSKKVYKSSSKISADRSKSSSYGNIDGVFSKQKREDEKQSSLDNIKKLKEKETKNRKDEEFRNRH